MHRLRIVPALATLTLLLAQGAPRSDAATVTIVNADGVNEGFNDPTPATPVGGNSGTTVGAQRLQVFQFAAAVWGSLLPSTVEVRIRARFDPLFCAGSAAVLGQAGPSSMWRDFSGALLSGHWYHVALANRLAGSDLSTNDDIDITFNGEIGVGTCMPAGWYYGLDGNEGSRMELLPVVLHEMAHGFGFSTSTNGSTGEYASGYPCAFDRYLMDPTLGRSWDQMTVAERAASAVGCRRLVWAGSNVVREAPNLLNDKPLVRVNAPASIAGIYDVGTATFGPALTGTGVTGNVVLVNDGVGSTTNGCEALINAAAVSGKIALVDRGTCSFAAKVIHAQNAGAIAVLVADSLPGCPPQNMGGTDASITIPSARVTQDDGATLKSALAAGLNVTLLRDPTLSQGADASHRVMMYTPASYAGGSSVSHWDASADPDLLMEPSLMNSVSAGVDLARWLFTDLGWTGSSVDAPPTPVPTMVPPGLALSASPNPIRGQGAIEFWLAQEEIVTLEVLDVGGRLIARLLDREPRSAGRQSVPYDPGRLQNGIYFLRLTTASRRESGRVALVR